MSKDDAVERLNQLQSGDSELMHLQADRILLAFLRANGNAEIADAFKRADERIDFWYA